MKTQTQLQSLIDAAPPYEPQVEDIVLENEDPDTCATAFKKYSPVKHRYHTLDGWTICDQTNKYQSVQDEEEIKFYIREFIAQAKVKKRVKQPDGSYKTYHGATDAKMKSSSYIKNILNWVNTGDSHLKPSQQAPCSLNGTLNPEYIIALKNGLLDWSVYPYKLHPHTQEFYTLNYLPYDWQGEQDSDLWIDYLVTATSADVEMFQMLQMFAGYCFIRKPSKMKFLIIQGEANTGKSVFVDVLTAMLGYNNVSSIPLIKFDEPHFMVESYGKYLNVSDESEEMLQDPSIENTLKHYTGGTVFQFKRMYEKAFSAYPTAKILIATNHLPKFTDPSEGVWSRMLLAPFNVVIPDDKIDLNLAHKIIEQELSGVLKWTIEGARMLVKNNMKFVIPEVTRKALVQYRKEMLPEIEFLEENFESVLPGNENFSVECKTLRNCYTQWCKAHGVGEKGDKRLGQTIQKQFPLSERKRAKKLGNLTYIYSGIQMKRDSEFFQEGVL